MAMSVLFWLLVGLLGGFVEANTSLDWFDFYDEKALSGHDNEGITGIDEEECARRCLVGTSTVPFGSCLSFDYDHQYSKCVLSTANRDTPGANLADGGTRFDYYQRKASYSPCDFDSDLCQYTQDTKDNFDWTRDSGGTPTDLTGPTVDHTTGTSSGHYMYIETSAPRQRGDIARLISPSYRRYPDGQCLLFWAHMYGERPYRDNGYLGTLTVSVKVGERTSDIWTRSRNQRNQWFSVAVSIPATGSYQVIFEGVAGNRAHGDIAIDDVSILQRACPAGDVCAAVGGKGPCGQVCNNTAGSFTCSCNVGYTLQQDGLSCNDVNECSSNGGRVPCAHTCTNTPGSYTCSCNNGYNLNSDGHMCDHQSSPTDISRQEDHTHCNISWSSPTVPRGDIIGYKVYLQRDYLDSNGQAQRGEYDVKSTESTSIRLMKSTKTEILDLLPNSVYIINVTGFTYTGEGNFSQTVNCTVPPGKPSEPEPSMLSDPTKVASTTFPLKIKPASERNGPIGCYHVVVVKSSSTENLPDPEMLQPYKTLVEAKNSGSYYIAYIALALPPDTVGDSTTVTVGDGTVTSCNPQQAGRKRRALTSDDVYNQNYTNSPLDPDSHYTTSVRAYGPNDGEQPYFSASQYMDPVSTAADGEASTIPSHTFLAGMIGLGAVSALLLIALVAAVAVIVVLKRSSKSKREATGTTVQNDAFDDTYYTDTRTNPANQDGTYCDVMDGRSTKRRGQADGTSQEGEYDVPDVSGEEGAYQTLDPRTLENSEYQNLRK